LVGDGAADRHPECVDDLDGAVAARRETSPDELGVEAAPRRQAFLAAAFFAGAFLAGAFFFAGAFLAAAFLPGALLAPAFFLPRRPAGPGSWLRSSSICACRRATTSLVTNSATESCLRTSAVTCSTRRSVFLRLRSRTSVTTA